MEQINWIPEENGEAGGFEAAGFLKLLGAPELEDVEILVRETAQNSWDARSGKELVYMEFNGATLTKGDTEYHALVNEIFRQKPKPEQFPELNATLSKAEVPVLIIRDSRTKGLGGATNARSVGTPNATNRYRRFLLNIGEQGYAELGGGAYGYGRSICFSASHSHTAVIYSRTKDDLEDFESRLITVGYGNQFPWKKINHNGRHWWTTSETVGRPTTGKKADLLAQRLGIEPYKENESGTTIMMIDPNLGENLEDSMKAIALSIEMHLWPKYIQIQNADRPQQMKFSVSLEGKQITIRNPADIDPLKHYVRAFATAYKRNLEQELSQDVTNPLLKHASLFLRTDARSNPIGQLSVSSYPKVPLTVDQSDTSKSVVLRRKLSQLNHHVALMRDPDLVVEYYSVKENQDTEMGTAGVFKADQRSNELLRKSEPTTHDAWTESHQDPSVRRLTIAVHRNINRFIDDEINPSPKQAMDGKITDNSHASLLSKHIGSLIWSELILGGGTGGATGGGNGGATGGGTGGGDAGGRGPTKLQPRISKPRLHIHNKQTALSWNIELPKLLSSTQPPWQIELQLASGDGDKYESPDPASDLPRFVLDREKKLVLHNLHTVRFTQIEDGESIEITAIVEKGTMVTIQVERLEDSI